MKLKPEELKAFLGEVAETLAVLKNSRHPAAKLAICIVIGDAGEGDTITGVKTLSNVIPESMNEMLKIALETAPDRAEMLVVKNTRDD